MALASTADMTGRYQIDVPWEDLVRDIAKALELDAIERFEQRGIQPDREMITEAARHRARELRT
jgi:hypothetical protein